MTRSVQHQSSVIYANYFTHTKPHSVTYKDGLNFYMFRLQSEGSCRALVGGKSETIIPGDLLIYPPDQPYELNVQPRSAPDSGAVQPVGDYFLAGNGEWLDSWWKTKTCPLKQTLALTIRSLPYGSILSAKRKKSCRTKRRSWTTFLERFV